jgi:acetyl esterase/lipase
MAGNMRPDPEFAAYLAAQPPIAPTAPSAIVPGADRATTSTNPEFQAARERLESAVAGAMAKFLPILGSVKETKHQIKSFDGVEITIHEFVRADLPELTEPSPAIVYLHGGGYLSCPIENIIRPGMAPLSFDMRLNILILSPLRIVSLA